jgi:hypothetical protein
MFIPLISLLWNNLTSLGATRWHLIKKKIGTQIRVKRELEPGWSGRTPTPLTNWGSVPLISLLGSILLYACWADLNSACCQSEFTFLFMFRLQSIFKKLHLSFAVELIFIRKENLYLMNTTLRRRSTISFANGTTLYQVVSYIISHFLLVHCIFPYYLPFLCSCLTNQFLGEFFLMLL